MDASSIGAAYQVTCRLTEAKMGEQLRKRMTLDEFFEWQKRQDKELRTRGWYPGVNGQGDDRRQFAPRYDNRKRYCDLA